MTNYYNTRGNSSVYKGKFNVTVLKTVNNLNGSSTRVNARNSSSNNSYVIHED